MNTGDAIPTTWTTGTTEVFKTGTWRAALPQHIRAPSPCHAACPVNGDIAEWIGRARAHDFRGAWEILTRHNPFPAVAGRICHHPCEAACNRAGFDESLAICRLERYVGDRALAEGWAFAPIEAPRKERIAVVGGGPSGLSAAFHLRRRGYAVTLFESRPELGGLMRYGIPSYRLARSVLDGEIARIVALGIDVHCGQSLETPKDFERLRREFGAVYLAIGARCQKRLPRLDYTQPWVMDGADYLARANSGDPPALGKRLVVIGGGSAAIDVARSARRAGHEVTILALESRSQMPAQNDEVAEALEEGIALVDGAMLIEAVDRGAAGLALKCVRVRFEAGAQRGQFTVIPLADSDFTLKADAILPSIGQDPDLAPLQGALDADGTLLKVNQWQATNLDRVYAGGDVASIARFVTEAIGMGKRAAREIDRRLRESASGRGFRARADRRACGDQHVLSPQAGARNRATGGRRTAPQERQRGPDRLRPRASARRGRALLLLRHLHPVRQLRSLLPRSRGQARGRRLRGIDRLLQGLRHLRQGVPHRLDEDDRGVAMSAAGPRRGCAPSGGSAAAAAASVGVHQLNARDGTHPRGKPMLLTGNHAVAWAARLARPKVVPLYPITPQTPILEKITEFQANGEFDAEVITPESEHSVMAACIPASLAGVRVFTATASQGLLLMHELLHYASGARAPIVMANVNRTVASPWGFWPDQTDSLSQRDTGWIQFYTESAQESLDTVIHAFRVAERLLLPMMVNLDAFYVSHALEPVLVPEQDLVDAYLPPYAPLHRLDTEKVESWGNVVTPDMFYRHRQALGAAMDEVPRPRSRLIANGVSSPVVATD